MENVSVFQPGDLVTYNQDPGIDHRHPFPMQFLKTLQPGEWRSIHNGVMPGVVIGSYEHVHGGTLWDILWGNRLLTHWPHQIQPWSLRR